MPVPLLGAVSYVAWSIALAVVWLTHCILECLGLVGRREVLPQNTASSEKASSDESPRRTNGAALPRQDEADDSDVIDFEDVGLWKLGAVLGDGQFGIVRRSTRHGPQLRGLPSLAACKIISRSPHNQREIVDRRAKRALPLQTVVREVEILRSLNHPNIVQLYGYAESSKSVFILTELLSGGEVFHKLMQESDQRFTETDAIKVSRGVASALAYLHSNHIMHRDVKPENVVYASNEPGADVKLVDFGFAMVL